MATSQKVPHHLHAAAVVPYIGGDAASWPSDTLHFAHHCLRLGHEIEHQPGHHQVTAAVRPGQRQGVADFESHAWILDLVARRSDESIASVDPVAGPGPAGW